MFRLSPTDHFNMINWILTKCMGLGKKNSFSWKLLKWIYSVLEKSSSTIKNNRSLCNFPVRVCVCVCACVRACVCMCVVCVHTLQWALNESWPFSKCDQYLSLFHWGLQCSENVSKWPVFSLNKAHLPNSTCRYAFSETLFSFLNTELVNPTSKCMGSNHRFEQDAVFFLVHQSAMLLSCQQARQQYSSQRFSVI